MEIKLKKQLWRNNRYTVYFKLYTGDIWIIALREELFTMYTTFKGRRHWKSYFLF